jgi:hypothetical protein
MEQLNLNRWRDKFLKLEWYLDMFELTGEEIIDVDERIRT